MRRRGPAPIPNQRPKGPWGRARLLGLLALMLLFAVGCQGKNKIKDKDDPLINGPPIPPPRSAPIKAKSSVPAPAAVPAVPAYSSSAALNNAALASGGSLDGTRELSIPAARQNTSGGWQGQPTGNPDAVLRKPEPITDPVPRVTKPGATGVAPSGPTVAAPPPPTKQQLEGQLKVRGMLWDQPVPTMQGVRYFAAFPNPTSPDQPRIVEVVAATQEQAMQTVLEQVGGR